MQPSFLTFGSVPSTEPYAVAVVMPSLLRDSLPQALVSVFRQEHVGRVQILIGVDRAPDDYQGALDGLAATCRLCPEGWTVQIFWPGYSTSLRHGGVTAARDGGSMRTLLSFLAHAPRVAYLDDDNWWRPDHLSGLLAAIEGRDWAWSLRWYVHPQTRRPVCVDRWESVGPGEGLFAEVQGGFVDPNCLMIDRVRAPDVLWRWSVPLPGDQTGMTADRMLFQALRQRPCGASGAESAYYVVRESDGMHPFRLKMMQAAWEQAGMLA